jgi:hypothetical protein
MFMFRNMFRKQVTEVQDAWILAYAIVDTVREPLIVLDQDLRVVAASRSSYLAFKVNADDTQGKLLYDLGDGQWDIPQLRLPLGKIVREEGAMENYEVEHDFPSIGRRTMLLMPVKSSMRRAHTPQSCLALRTLLTNASSKTKRMI